MATLNLAVWPRDIGQKMCLLCERPPVRPKVAMIETDRRTLVPELLTELEVAAALRTTVEALRALRQQDAGPPWCRLPLRRIAYPAEQLREWIKDQTIRPGEGGAVT